MEIKGYFTRYKDEGNGIYTYCWGAEIDGERKGDTQCVDTHIEGRAWLNKERLRILDGRV